MGLDSSKQVMNKNVFMIMCHKNVSQVLRLAKHCISEKTDVIVHADSLMPENEYVLLKAFSQENKQFFLTDDRIHGKLDGESLIHITMEMVHKAYYIEQNSDIHYQYFCLLSGQDYLIKPIGFINENLEKEYPRPFIDCTPYDKNNWMHNKLRWNPFTNKLRLKIDSIFKNKQRHPVRVALMVMLLSLSKIMQFITPSLYHQIRKKAGVYGGSAWWILPDKAMKYISEEYDSKSELVNLILQAITPEELFFQIMSMQSPIKELIEINPKDASAQNCKTWAYFYDEDKPPVSHPYTFTVNEYEKLVKSDRWIARKFDAKVDADILDMLDAHILN